MRACLAFVCILTATFTLSVKSKPHGKQHGLHKTPHTAKEKDVITEEANKPQILPTLVPFEAISQEQGDGELSSEGNASEDDREEAERKEKSTAVLLSEEELVDMLKREAEEEEQAETSELENEDEVKSGDAEDEEKKVEDGLRTEEELVDEDNLEEEVEMMTQEEKSGGPVGLLEEDGSTESEIPVDLDYAADSSLLQPLQTESTKAKPHKDDTLFITKPATPDVKEKETSDKELPSIAEDYELDMQNTEASNDEEVSSQSESGETKAVEKEPQENVDSEEPKSSAEVESGPQQSETEEEKNKNDSGSHTKGKMRKQKKNHRARKHSPQKDETRSRQEPSQQEPQELEGGSTDNKVQKAKRRRAGKWGPLVGMNPVQIRATVDLYPRSRPSLGEVIDLPEAPADPCNNFRCKRGKTCKLDADNNPRCVCQQASECRPSVSEFDHVCGTDNKTYDTSCQLFATKCNLEGTKRGNRLHLDYTGPCKLIPACMDAELIQFPLRMRDWLKNVLLQLYEHDSVTQGFLTPKQRFRVKKIFESDRRLHAGDHSVELLAQDFEKNYNMYIYPVHWQFAQLDQHPSDRFLSHSELAPLRVPLVPMEHCTSRFFTECDADKDKQVSLKEWTSCFGIKKEDLDVNLLF
ncbi:SPARC-like protein 1 [Pholidichthys leucotaenia]